MLSEGFTVRLKHKSQAYMIARLHPQRQTGWGYGDTGMFQPGCAAATERDHPTARDMGERSGRSAMEQVCYIVMNSSSAHAATNQAGSAGIKDIQRTLLGIFEYYSTPSSQPGERMVRASKLRRMCLDSGIVSDDQKSVTDVRVDLIFTRIHSAGDQAVQGLNKRQFMDAVVALAEEKYQTGNSAASLARLYADHLSSFSPADDAGTEREGAVEAAGGEEQTDGGPSCEVLTSRKRGADEEVTRVLDACRPSLMRLYCGYFPMELHGEDPERDKSAAATHTLYGYSQKQLSQVFIDFELCPVILPKSQIFQVFRNVMKDEKIAEAAERSIGLGGRYFTYTHFEAALLRTARALFVDLDIVTGAPTSAQTDAARLIRLFDRMDQSRGRVRFASLPMIARASSQPLRLLPPDFDRTSLSFKSRPKSAVKMVSRALRSDTVVTDDCSDVSTNIELPEQEDDLVTSVFSYYVMLGNPLNRTQLGTAKFHRFLRDAGLMKPAGSETLDTSTAREEHAKVSQLNSAAADLIFLRSTERAKDRSSAKHRHYLDRDGFQRALVRVGRAFYGHQVGGTTDAEVVRRITRERIKPLLQVLGSPCGADGELVHECLSDLQDSQSGLSKTLATLHPGIRAIFQRYAGVEGMSLEGFMDFCKDFEISSNAREDITGCSRLPLQRIFYDASHEIGHPDHRNGRSHTDSVNHREQYSSALTLSTEAFTLSFIMLSRKLMSQSLPPAERLQRFAARLNHTSAASSLNRSAPLFLISPTVEVIVGATTSASMRSRTARGIRPDPPAFSKAKSRALVAGKATDLVAADWETALRLWEEGY
ncbi:hypothetical protein FOL47_009309 [Perkinsus chesapeaki]|uniref:Uncharacterized protein n=1 Tax=Perkinsus chesapeaki TaxID=330153 RepID=A0A7J6MT61_PERCH|nr:hypothetical protein FOL47_009309 [Perkinsus chesapeaki]